MLDAVSWSTPTQPLIHMTKLLVRSSLSLNEAFSAQGRRTKIVIKAVTLNSTFLGASSEPVSLTQLFKYAWSLILIQSKGMNSHFNELYWMNVKAKA